MLETRWHLIRHAPVDNPEGRIYGSSDKSANTSNANAFQLLAQRLPREGIAITSHLKRTQQTLDALISGGLEVSQQIIENRLGNKILVIGPERHMRKFGLFLVTPTTSFG